MNKKNLKIFTSSFPYGKGEQFFEDELKLLRKDFNIIIQPYYYGHSKVCRMYDKSIVINRPLLGKPNIIRMILNYRIFFYLLKGILKILYSKEGNKQWQILELMRAIYGLFNFKVEKGFEKYYFYWGIGAAYYIPAIKKYYKNIKIICRYHGSDLYEEIHGGSIPLRKEILLNSNYNIAISEYGQNYIKNKYDVKSICIRLGSINNKGLGRPSYDHIFRIVSCSSIIEIKRIDYIADVICSLEFPVEWHHFGDGKEKNKVQEIIRYYKKENICHIHGYTKKENILEYYLKQANDLFINLSVSEGIPVSIMEAQSFGIPAVALNIGGLSEIIIPELLIKIDKKELIINTINSYYKKWVKNPEYLRENARKIWENKYKIEENYKILKNILQN
jgi:colanic acid/amylovoran biosynthesis glycosyltransferase